MVFLAACTPETGASAPEASAAEASPTATLPAPAEPIAPPLGNLGALDQYTVRVWGSFAGMSQSAIIAQTEAQFRRQQEYISACMHEQGFTYYPAQFFTESASVNFPDWPPIGSREFAEQWGFAISNVPEGFTRRDDVIAANTVTSHMQNDEIRSLMSPAELEAWDYALAGEYERWTFIDDVSDLADWGCIGSAHLAVGGVPGFNIGLVNPTHNPEFDAIAAEVVRFRDSVVISLEVSQLNTDWMACMATNGYAGFANPSQARRTLHDEWWEILDTLEGPPDDHFGSWTAPDPDPDGIFASRELALALADVECREQLDYDARYQAIDHLLQQQFVAVFGNELEAWASYAEARRGEG